MSTLCAAGQTIYLDSVSGPSIQPAEIRAAAEVHHELGPDYRDAVIESFLEKVGREIDARVDARLAGNRTAPAAPVQDAQHLPAAHQHSRGSGVALAIVSMSLGIPLSAIVVGVGQPPVGLAGLLIVWAAIAVINVAYAVQRPGPR
jgi:hypothetical protein